jgi:hypothetical protein
VGRQLALPLEPGAESESALKHAWSVAHLRVPFDVAIRVPALAICLRNIAAAQTRRKTRRRRTARAQVYPEMQRWTWEETEPVESPYSS